MRPIKTIAIASFLSLFLWTSCDKKPNVEAEVTNEISKDLQRFAEKRSKKPRPITQRERQKYRHNLDISKDTASYYNIEDAVVNVVVPVPNESFEYFGSYNVSSGSRKAILFIINNKNRDTVCGKDMNYLLEKPIGISSVGRTTLWRKLKMRKGEKLLVFTYSDHYEDFKDKIKEIRKSYEKYVRDGDISFDCGQLPFFKDFDPENKQPKESGGGVIVEGP
jgi:hypothetical protein